MLSDTISDDTVYYPADFHLPFSKELQMSAYRLKTDSSDATIPGVAAAPAAPSAPHSVPQARPAQGATSAPAAQPSARAPQPNTQTSQPSARAPQPNAQTAQPNAQTAQPNTQTSQPNTQTAQPNTQTAQPNARAPQRIVRVPPVAKTADAASAPAANPSPVAAQQQPQTRAPYATAASNAILAEVKTRFRPIFMRISAGAVDRENRRALAYDEIKALQNTGFGALRVPRELGGFGLSIRQLFDFLIDLATADSNIVQALRPHWCFVEGLRLERSPRSERWLKKIVVEGRKIIGNAVTELGVGAVERYNTRITETPEGLRLNGVKFYSTGSLYADYISVAADWNGRRVSALVDAHAPGVSQSDDWDGFGQRLTASGSASFANTPVRREDIFEQGYGSSGRTWVTAYLELTLLTAMAGAAKRAEQDALDWVRPRTRTFSHAPADLPREDPLVQETIGQISAAAFGARAAVLAVADALDAAINAGGENPGLLDAAERAAAQAQSVVINLSLDATSRLFEVGGASIASSKNALDRHWRNVRTLAAHNPLSYKHRALGAHLLNSAALPYQWSAGVRKSDAKSGGGN
jgi:alkylation response protein AidB-like acyl-CoA dehydrogenase